MRTIPLLLTAIGVLATPFANAQDASTDSPPPPASASPAAGVGSGPSSVSGPTLASSANDWKLDYHGYFRAPMRMGFGHQDNVTGYQVAGQNASTIHYPVVPDDQYNSWQYTSVEAKDWSELFFTYGNNVARGTVSLQGYNFTDAAYQQTNAQFGIGQAWLTLTPATGYQNLRLQAKVGAFWDKYGMAGKYDAGKYDMYLFGRTHQMGETLRLELDRGKYTFWAEEGFGAKQPDPQQYNAAKFTLLGHLHAGVSWNRIVNFGLHAMHSWAREEDRDNSGTNGFCLSTFGCTDQFGAKFALTTTNDKGLSGLPDGSLSVIGPELAIRNTILGELYLGYSHVGATHAWVVDGAVETIHSAGGGQFHQGVVGNYLESTSAANPTGASGPGTSGGTGSVDTFLLQYDFSVANLFSHLARKGQFYGDGPDVTLSYFMMYNKVHSLDTNLGNNGSLSKLKFGFDVLGTPLKWFGVGLRFDDLMPNNTKTDQSFMILSPRLVFKTAFVTHEQVSLQYSRYFYARRQCSTADATACVQPPPGTVQPNGFGNPGEYDTPPGRGAPTKIPDENVVSLSATMWW